MRTNYGALLHSSMSATDNTAQYHGSCLINEVRPSLYTGVNSYIGRHYHLTRINRCSDYVGYRIEIVCLIGHPTTLHTNNENQWPTAARRCHFALWDLSRRQSWHFSTPSHPTVPSLWTYCQQAQFGCWFNVSLPFAWITGPATNPSIYKLSIYHMAASML